MTLSKTDIYVYAHWKDMAEPQMMGVLVAQQAKEKKHLVLSMILLGLKMDGNFY